MEKGIDPLETREAMAVEILTAEKLREEFQEEKLTGLETIPKREAVEIQDTGRIPEAAEIPDIEKLPEVTEASKADPHHREEAELIRVPEET